MLAFEFVAGRTLLLQLTRILAVSLKWLAHTRQQENYEKNSAHQIRRATGAKAVRLPLCLPAGRSLERQTQTKLHPAHRPGRANHTKRGRCRNVSRNGSIWLSE